MKNVEMENVKQVDVLVKTDNVLKKHEMLTIEWFNIVSVAMAMAMAMAIAMVSIEFIWNEDLCPIFRCRSSSYELAFIIFRMLCLGANLRSINSSR